MPEIVTIPLADLLVDTRNARLRDEQVSQQAAILALAKHQKHRLLNLAADIVEHGLDPTTLPAVVPTDDQRKRYTVVEGNRRIVALKALETPSLVAPAFDARGQRRLNALADRFAKKPIDQVSCVLFESEKDLLHWVELRHTGQREGVGLVEWGSDEKDRFRARHGQRSPEGQVLDFVERAGLLSERAQSSPTRIVTNLRRLLSTPYFRERVGVDIIDGQVVSHYPYRELAKSLSKVVEDLKTRTINVGDIYDKDARVRYANSLGAEYLPDPATRLDAPVALGGDALGTQPRRPSGTKPRRRRPRPPVERTALIPKSSHLEIHPPRINQIYNELLTLSVDQFLNACSVLLRVFVELSVDHYLEAREVMSEPERRNKPLAARMKAAAADLRSRGEISSQLEEAVELIANNKGVLAASVPTFNMYVHNPYVFPKPQELRLAWQQLQPFIEKLWS